MARTPPSQRKPLVIAQARQVGRSVAIAKFDVRLRPAAFERDLEFLYRVYASTRAEEMALVGWTADQQEAFLRMQFQAQHSFYQEQFPAAEYSVLERRSNPIGRLYLDRRPAEFRVIDIALLPEHRGAGIGGALMRRIIDEASLVGKCVRIHVERHNPAMSLYSRLGFRKIEDQGIYWLMERAAGSRGV